MQLLIEMDSWESAAVLSGAINAHSAARAFGTDALLMDSATERLTDSLGSSSWSEATGRGALMSPDDAVTFAVEAIDQAANALKSGRKAMIQARERGRRTVEVCSICEHRDPPGDRE